MSAHPQIERRKGTRLKLSMGVAMLLGVYITELAGRFDLGRISVLLEGIDVRIVLLGGISLWYLAWISVERPKPSYKPHLAPLVLFIAWLLLLTTTSLWTDPAAEVFQGVFDLALMGVLTVLAWAVARRTNVEAANLLFVTALITSYIYLGAAITQGMDLTNRLSAFGGGPNVFVRVMLFGALAALALAVIWHRPLLAMACVPPLIGAVLSGSRGGLFAAVLVLLLAVFIVAKRVEWSRMVGASVPVLALLAAAWNWLPSDRRDYVRVRILQQTFEERYTSSRDTLASYALELFREHPIGGAGLGSFSATFRPGMDGYHAHNLVLSTVAEGGLLATILLFGALVAAVVFLVRRRPLSVEVQFLALFSFFIFIASMFSGDYYDSRFLWFFMVLAVVWGAPRVETANTHKKTPSTRTKSNWPQISQRDCG